MCLSLDTDGIKTSAPKHVKRKFTQIDFLYYDVFMTNQYAAMFVIPVVVACVARTVCDEEIFREIREFLQERSKTHPKWYVRKVCYMPTCEYCFSHYVTLVVLLFTHHKLLYDGFLGYLVSFFVTVFLANIYMSLYARVRVSITAVKTEAKVMENGIKQAAA